MIMPVYSSGSRRPGRPCRAFRLAYFDAWLSVLQWMPRSGKKAKQKTHVEPPYCYFEAPVGHPWPSREKALGLSNRES